MTRHPTTADMRRTVAALLSAGAKTGTTPLSHRERAVADEAKRERGHARRYGDEKDSRPRVPIIGVDSGAVPGSRPDQRW